MGNINSKGIRKRFISLEEFIGTLTLYSTTGEKVIINVQIAYGANEVFQIFNGVVV